MAPQSKKRAPQEVAGLSSSDQSTAVTTMANTKKRQGPQTGPKLFRDQERSPRLATPESSKKRKIAGR